MTLYYEHHNKITDPAKLAALESQYKKYFSVFNIKDDHYHNRGLTSDDTKNLYDAHASVKNYLMT